MPTLLLKNAAVLATMDDAGTEIANGGLFARDGVIVEVGPSSTLPATADETIDLAGHVVIPGLVNTHHHLYQTLTRAVPAAQDASLFGWLTALYPIWARMGPEHIHVSALTGLAELLLSGCTAASDHLYMFPNGARLDDEIDAARQIGIRFTASRGSMSIGQSKGGLPPDSVVESEEKILVDCERVIGAYHDPSPHALLHIALAPCSPFSVSTGLMRDTAALARRRGVRLHTHLAENDDDLAYAQKMFGQRPGAYVESTGWVGGDVWHAHGVKLNADEIDLFAATGTGVAHCPCSNMRLASGIAPVRKMLNAGVPVGLGVDGSASNDSGDLLAEARQAMLLQRVGGSATTLSARDALRMATRGGARVLGRQAAIGQLTAGFAADIAAYDLSHIAFAGAWDPVAALVFCGIRSAAYTIVGGRVVVREGALTTIDLPVVLERHNALARALIDDA